MKALPRTEGLDEACRLVGRFLKHYATLEQAIDAAIGKILGITGGAVDIVCGNIPVAKKDDVLFTAESFLAAMPDKDRRAFLKKTRSAIMTLNDDRVMMAHCAFKPGPDGTVIFRKVLTRGNLNISSVERSSEMVEEACEIAFRVTVDLGRIIEEMRPYEPSLDFSDPRNSGLGLFMGML